MVAFKKLIKVVELQEMSVTFAIKNCGNKQILLIF